MAGRSSGKGEGQGGRPGAENFFKRLKPVFTSEKTTTCGGGLKVAKLAVVFSSTLHPYGVLPHIPPALLVVC
jgi:hypothetical protein